ncbi:MAG: hypothetical protein E7592_06690 [Ruminococcaceae bacterium]|nr:hypothetical protein [Oscillospiraceae bacterium]
MKKISLLALLLVIALCLPTLVACDDMLGNIMGGGGNKNPEKVTESEKTTGVTETTDVTETAEVTETALPEDTVIFEDTTLAETTESINIYEEYTGNWYMAVDSFRSDDNENFSNAVKIKSAITNNRIGTTLTGVEGTYTSVIANYVRLEGGWFAVDGCDIEGLNCKVYAADGTLLDTIVCNLRKADNNIVHYVTKSMGYANNTVPYKIDPSSPSVIDLTGYAGQTVTVVYEADVVDYDNDLEMIRINVTVPEHADEIMIDGWLFHHNDGDERMDLSAELTSDGLYSSAYSVNGTPYLRMTTMNTVDLKQGVYMKIRIDEFNYSKNLDSWFNVMLCDQQYVLPGSHEYGQGVQNLIRPGINNMTYWYYEEFTPVQYQHKYENIPQDVDGQGRQYLTVELSWDEANDTFVYTINGVSAPKIIIDYMNNKWGGNKSYAYVGFCFQHNSPGEKISCTLLDFIVNVVYPGPDVNEPDVDETEEETSPVAENKFEGNWIAVQDFIEYASKSDYSDINNSSSGGSTNNTNGNVPCGLESGITARYLCFGGFLGVDGYSLEGAYITVYATNGKTLETTLLINDQESQTGRYFVAENGAQDFLVNGMGFAKSTVGYRYYSPIIDLTEYENSTVIVVCELDLAGSDETVNILKLTVTVPEDPDVYKENWHCAVDCLLGDMDGNMDGIMNGDFSNVDVVISPASTNKYHGNTIIDSAEVAYPSITARCVSFMTGWIVVDGYDIDSWSCRIYAADGTLLETVELGLNPAERGVIDHVENNMGYGEGTVPYRVNHNAPEIIDLTAYEGQTVTLVYEAGLAGSEKLVEMVEIDVIVPEAPEEDIVPGYVSGKNLVNAVNVQNGFNAVLNSDGTVTITNISNNSWADDTIQLTQYAISTRYAVIKYKTTDAGQAVLYATTEGNDVGGYSRFNTINDGEWHTLVLDLSNINGYVVGDEILFMRLDVCEQYEGQSLTIDYIAFLDDVSEVSGEISLNWVMAVDCLIADGEGAGNSSTNNSKGPNLNTTLNGTVVEIKGWVAIDGYADYNLYYNVVDENGNVTTAPFDVVERADVTNHVVGNMGYAENTLGYKVDVVADLSDWAGQTVTLSIKAALDDSSSCVVFVVTVNVPEAQ